ncbi:copper homeostasis protein CutC [uncultured Clostridium sp.]|jgi:copper homeostasis protein|uniref:copper homeostasis protein CutC n=1 Tax=uncultured Clostridium sp. TaxID=59620 RepID=UPI00260C8FAB|nr:copper homeostasis protein CutC [uncultured Clostridium sp.]
MEKVFEVCVGNYIEAIMANKKGADRIELCDNLYDGGTTPSYGTIKKVLEDVKTKVMVIIRPRGGNFEFSLEEIEIMREDIKMCKSLGAYGVVIGQLVGNKINYEITKEFTELARPMSVTFHMAFDEVLDKDNAIEELVGLGIDRILTKGGDLSAYECMDELKRLNEIANDRIIIMPGKGVNIENRDKILEKTGTHEIHGSKVI